MDIGKKKKKMESKIYIPNKTETRSDRSKIMGVNSWNQENLHSPEFHSSWIQIVIKLRHLCKARRHVLLLPQEDTLFQICVFVSSFMSNLLKANVLMFCQKMRCFIICETYTN